MFPLLKPIIIVNARTDTRRSPEHCIGRKCCLQHGGTPTPLTDRASRHYAGVGSTQRPETVAAERCIGRRYNHATVSNLFLPTPRNPETHSGQSRPPLRRGSINTTSRNSSGRAPYRPEILPCQHIKPVPTNTAKSRNPWRTEPSANTQGLDQHNVPKP